MSTCESCEHRISGTVRRSVTGRELCDACHRRLLGLTAGIMASGSNGLDPVASAISTEGWFSRLRRRRRQD